MLQKKLWKSCASLLLAALLMMAGCDCNNGSLLVCVADLTGSIQDKARTQVFNTIELLGKSLKRCDTLVIVFVTSDALTQGQANILRFQVKGNRQAYDADLKKLFDQIHRDLEEMKVKVNANPYLKSVLLGAIELAAEEVASNSKMNAKVVAVLSDFIEDDSTYDFKRDAELSNEQQAVDLASALAKKQSHSFQGVPIYLGLLQSVDLGKLPQNRRLAIRSFWENYLHNRGASIIISATDGTGQIDAFLKKHLHPTPSSKPGWF